MSRFTDLMNSMVTPKSELEKEMDSSSEIEKREKGISWGLVFLWGCVLWAVIALVRAVIYFL